MGKKHCRCERPRYHVHYYCICTQVEDCHRHFMKGVTCPAPDTPGHKHEYEGVTSCNDCHTHKYDGCTGRANYSCFGHTHDLCGKTCRANDHKHCYEGRTSRDRVTGRC